MMECAICKGKNEVLSCEYYAYGKDENGNQKYICQYCLGEGARNIFRALIKSRKESEEE